MKRMVPGIALALASAWGCSGGGGGGGVEIPTVEVGGAGGARLMNGQPKSPAEAYDNAYSQLARAHYNVRRNLDSRGQNEFGAREAMKQILASLDAMRACVPEADRGRFAPYQERYGGWLKELETGTWGGSFLTDFDRTEREIKSKFSPATTEVIADTPAAPKTPAPAPAPANPAAPAAPANPEPAPAVSARAFFKAWSAAHDDLLAGYKEKKPCKPKYDDVIEALRAMKERLPGDKAARLQIYIDYYGGIEEKTRGFTALPEKTTEKDILDELDVAARVIRKEFNPDK